MFKRFCIPELKQCTLTQRGQQQPNFFAQLIPDEVAFYLLGLQACFVESLEFGILVWQEIGFYHEGRV